MKVEVSSMHGEVGTIHDSEVDKSSLQHLE